MPLVGLLGMVQNNPSNPCVDLRSLIKFPDTPREEVPEDPCDLCVTFAVVNANVPTGTAFVQWGSGGYTTHALVPIYHGLVLPFHAAWLRVNINAASNLWGAFASRGQPINPAVLQLARATVAPGATEVIPITTASGGATTYPLPISALRVCPTDSTTGGSIDVSVSLGDSAVAADRVESYELPVGTVDTWHPRSPGQGLSEDQVIVTNNGANDAEIMVQGLWNQ